AVSVNVWGPLDGASAGIMLVMVPDPPTTGVVFDQPAGATRLTKVVPGGSVSAIVTLCASLGPLLMTVIVYVRFCPGPTGSGVSFFEITRSASGESVVVAVELLLAGLVSVVLAGAVTVAVLLTLPIALEAIVVVKK